MQFYQTNSPIDLRQDDSFECVNPQQGDALKFFLYTPLLTANQMPGLKTISAKWDIDIYLSP